MCRFSRVNKSKYFNYIFVDGRKSRCPSDKEGTLKGRVLSLRDAPLAGANISLAESPYLIMSRSQDNGFFVVDLFCFDKEKPLLITRNGYVPQIVEVANTRSVLKVKMENAGMFLYDDGAVHLRIIKRTRVAYSDQLQQPFTLVVSLSRGSRHHMLDTIHFSAECVGGPYNIVYYSI